MRSPFVGFVIVLLLLAACKEEPQPVPKKKEVPPVPKVEKPKDTLIFTPTPIRGFTDLKNLEEKIGAEHMLVVLKINRVDRKHIRDDDTLAIPNVFDDRLIPFPLHVDSLVGVTKLIMVSRRAQAFAAYDSGSLVRWGPTSTGKKATPTPAGLYSANWKKELATSTVDPAWLLPWCVNIQNLEGISFHQFDLPGYPASHSCIRLLDEDARWIYDWVDTWRLTKDARLVLAQGTPVIVFDDYPYGSSPLRKKIARNMKAHYVDVAAVDSVLLLHMNTIHAMQKTRQDVIAASDSLSKQPIL